MSYYYKKKCTSDGYWTVNMGRLLTSDITGIHINGGVTVDDKGLQMTMRMALLLLPIKEICCVPEI